MIVKPFAIDTPALLLEADRLVENTQRMRDRLGNLGVALRPHVKTAKCAEVAALAVDRGGAITVSTLHEAEVLFAREFEDILYAVSIHPARFPRVAALLARGAKLGVVTDDQQVARELADYSTQFEQPLRVSIEIDTGDHRAGLLPDDPNIVELGKTIDAAAKLELHGVMTHAGHSYRVSGEQEIAQVAEQERAGVVAAADRLRAAGLPCPVVSAGSTPTARFARDLTGVTEMRPGVYVFNDLFQEAIGVCERSDLALSVLATVMGHNRHAGHLLIDTGALALSKDLSANALRPEVGFGEVCDAASLAHHEGLYVRAVSQEHGEVPVPGPVWFERLPVGAQVRILPNHACITAAAHKHYFVIEGGAQTVRWKRTGGW